MANRFANLDGTKKIKDEYTKINTGFDGVEQELDEHIADNVTDSGGVHGLAIESGAWTPTLSGGSVAGTNTYSLQSGSYYKVGKLVVAKFQLVLTAVDASISGALQVTGLPFAIASSDYGSVAFTRFGKIKFTAGYTQLVGYGTGSVIQLRQAGDDVDSLTIESSTNVQATTNVLGVITYVAA